MYLGTDDEVEQRGDGLWVGWVDNCDVVEVKDEWSVPLKHQSGVYVSDVRLTTEPVNNSSRSRDCHLGTACHRSTTSRYDTVRCGTTRRTHSWREYCMDTQHWQNTELTVNIVRSWRYGPRRGTWKKTWRWHCDVVMQGKICEKGGRYSAEN